MTKKETIRELLRTFNDARETLSGGGPGDGAPWQMSKLWHEGGYPELERCLRLMVEQRPKQYIHVRERFLNCERRRREVVLKGGRYQLPAHWAVVGEDGGVKRGKRKGTQIHREQRIVESWGAWVDAQKVEKGLEWLTEAYRGEPYLPSELFALRAA